MDQIETINQKETTTVYKLGGVHVEGPGFQPERPNDVLVCLPTDRPAVMCESHVVFFGGDTQDYEENMLGHRDNRRYAAWNLVSTALLLQRKFPRSIIWVVRASSLYLQTFAAYHNFVESNDFGTPTHSEDGHCLYYLRLLLRGCIQKMATTLNEEFVLRNIELVGFSKGCVVLNQCMFEFVRAMHDQTLSEFVRRITSMYWLDGGHRGEHDTWVVHDHVLLALKYFHNVNVHVHVTPYQMEDPMRKWIGDEKRHFVKRVRELHIRVMSDQVHFVDEPRSIENHFKILANFK